MTGKKATVALAALSLLVFVCGGPDGASGSPAHRLSTTWTGSDRARPGDIGHDCATLSVVALTSNVSSFRNKVAFQVSGAPWCSWSATSALIQEITPSQGAGAHKVTGVLPANSSEQGRTALFTVTSADGAIVRTATVNQAAAVYDCTGVDAQPRGIWPPGAFINVTVPPGWTWEWHPITNLMYNCTPNYPIGVGCYWQCTNIYPREGYAGIVAYGDGRRCVIHIGGHQPWCSP